MAFMSFCEAKFGSREEKKFLKKIRKRCGALEKITEKEAPVTPKASIQSCFSFHMNRRSCFDADCDSEPDRSNPLWKILPIVEESKDIEQYSNVSDENAKPSIWDEIMMEYEDKRLEYNNLLELSKPYQPPIPVFLKLSAVQYLEKYIFPLLCPALEETLLKAKEWECLMTQKCRFNGLDYIAELLWNRNPLHPKRRTSYRNIFDIPFAIIWLYYNPRPIYPLSWLWSKEESIIVLQTYIRRYIVCKEPECSEMRQFWTTVKMEKEKEKEEELAKSVEEIEALFNEIFDQIVTDAVFEAEWKIHGCRCLKKPCHCVCKCMKWCKCCNCHKNTPLDGPLCTCSKPEN